MTGYRVDRVQLEKEISELRASIADPKLGLFGPDTIVWEIAREAVIFLGSGRAALLQLAHPYVGTAIADHSITTADPRRRFQQTFRRIFRMVFGDLDEAVGAAMDVYRTHARVRGPIPSKAGPFDAGHPYDARDRDAQIWVLATLWDTSLWLFDAVVRPLTADDKEEYYRLSKRFASLFGIAADLPPTWALFEKYVRDMLDSDVLTVTDKASAIGRFIMRPDNALGRIVRDDFGVFTAHLLPEHVARGFGLERNGASGRRRFERVLTTARTVVPRLPDRVRYLPAYLDAMRRIRGETGRDRVGEVMTRLYLGSD